MQFIDSHCHLNMSDFDKDRDAVLSRAVQAGVQALVLISTCLRHTKELDCFIEKIQERATVDNTIIPDLYYSTGLHPVDCEEALEDPYDHLMQSVSAPKMIGFGETGLDYYGKNFNKQKQQQIFESHLKAAITANVPVIVHSRSAEEDTVTLLKEFPGVRGVIHCFTGSKEMAKACLDLGFYISFSGIVTFKNAADLQEIASFMPPDRILIETDAPYLAPIPYRGKRNEPAFLRHTLEFIADLKKITPDSLATKTTNNFFTLFNKTSKNNDRTAA